MKRRGRQKERSRRELTWFTIVGTLDEALEDIRGFYETLEAKHKWANETGDTSSPFYGWDLRRENVELSIIRDRFSKKVAGEPRDTEIGQARFRDGRLEKGLSIPVPCWSPTLCTPGSVQGLSGNWQSTVMESAPQCSQHARHGQAMALTGGNPPQEMG